METFRTAMNPAPLQNEEAPLPQPAPSPPNPVRDEIVQEANYIVPQAVPISSNFFGMSQNQSNNQLAGRIQKESDMLAEYEAQTPTEDEGFLDAIPLPSSPPPPSPKKLESSQEPPILSLEQPTPKKSGKGRPFSEVTPFQQHGIELYITARENGLVGDRSFLSTLSTQDREAYNNGRILVTQNKKNNPNVISYIKLIEDRYK